MVPRRAACARRARLAFRHRARQVRAAPGEPTVMTSDDEQATVQPLPPESLAWYHEVFGEAPVMVALHRHGRYLYLNRAGQVGLGADSLDEMLGRSVLDFVAPEERS